MDNLQPKRLKRDAKTFEHLPDEIIHKIFKSLDHNSLKSSALANKRCAEIIASSSVLMRRFKLQLIANNWHSKYKIEGLMNFERKIQTIAITDVIGSHCELVKVFKKFGNSLHSLTLANCKLDDFTLREILKNVEYLDSLVLSEVVVVRKLPAINPVGLRKLTSLTIYHCDWSIIKFIAAQIRSFDVKSYLDEGGVKSNLISFLSHQYKMKELSLRGTSSRTLFQQDELVTNCNYALDTLKLNQDFGKNSDNVNWHLTAFLSLHVDTLKKVEIIGPHCDHINGFVIANLENLTKLTLDVRGLPKDENFYEFLAHEPNKQLSELSLSGFFIQHDAIKKILMRYPSIKKLELNDWGNGLEASDMLNFISRNFPQLHQLSITEISSGESLQFSALTNLSVTYIRNTKKLVQFIMRNSSVDTLKVGLVYIGQVTNNFIDELNRLKNLKHLTFGGNGTALKSILELMKSKRSPNSLRSLELSLITGEKLTVSSGKAMKFYFPIEKTTKLEVI